MISKEHRMDKILNLDTPERYCELYGLQCYNPQVCVVDLHDSEIRVDSVTNFGFYAMFLKLEKCEISYGRTVYDNEDGTLVSIGPGQVCRCVAPEGQRPKCTALLFDKKLIQGTRLGKNIDKYSFFSYSSNEALHMSEDEMKIVLDCMEKIRIESENDTDGHSRDIIVMGIELLLEYCMRFYDRQFTSRAKLDKDILTRFESLLNEYFRDDNQSRYGLPTVKYFADKICLSPGYFGDLVKKMTGRTAQDIILDKIADLSKELLLGTDKSVSEVAYTLGFEYPQHFTRFFKKRTGQTPQDYRGA